jgi:hypothetical protein
VDYDETLVAPPGEFRFIKRESWRVSETLQSLHDKRDKVYERSGEYFAVLVPRDESNWKSIEMAIRSDLVIHLY